MLVLTLLLVLVAIILASPSSRLGRLENLTHKGPVRGADAPELILEDSQTLAV